MQTDTFVTFEDFLSMDRDDFIAFMERGGGQRVAVTPQELMDNVGRTEQNHPGDGSGSPSKERTAARQMDVTTGIAFLNQLEARRKPKTRWTDRLG